MEEEGKQQQLEGANRNKHVYEKLARELLKRGSDKTAEQCKAKIKKLKIDYRKVKDKHNRTGENRSNWKFFDAIDAVLGHRPTTRPPVVLDTSEQPEEDEEERLDENDEEVEGSAEQSHTSTSTEDTQPSSESSPSSIPKDNSALIVTFTTIIRY